MTTTTTTAAGGAAAGSPTSAAKTSRHRGGSWERQKQKWRAKIGANGKDRHLGLFDDEDEAARAYAAACRELGRDPRAAPAQSSAHRGVAWNKGRQRWVATIKVDGKSRHLGSFHDEDEAARAYGAACREIGRGPSNPPAAEPTLQPSSPREVR